VQQALGPGGAMETILKAKEAGKIKYIGFSAHTTKGALEALKGFKFDTAMFPINFVEYYTRGFGKEVLDLAQTQGAAVLAIKPLSLGAWARGPEGARKWWYRCTETQEEANLALRWTLSQKGVVAGVPPSYLDLLDLSIEAAKVFSPITEAEQEKLKAMAAGVGSLFKAEEERAESASVWPEAGCPASLYERCLKGYV
jgi:predicted aldo/keto reductase-like oxidoreductase